MSSIKNSIVVANWRGNISSIKEAKKTLKELSREFDLQLKAKEKLFPKKKQAKKDLKFYLSVPAPFIYPLQAFLKEKTNQKLNKIIIGAQNFEELDKTTKNNSITLTQLESVGAKFVILNSDYEINSNINKKIELISDGEEKEREDIDNIFIQRLKSISKKTSHNIASVNTDQEKNLKDSEADEIRKNILKAKERELQKLEEKLRFSLERKIKTVLVIKNNNDDLALLISFVKRMIKNIHYNLFDNLFICYETGKNFLHIDRINLDDCQEKVIAIRRTIANIFGIDNAKKVKILYSGVINASNVQNVLKEGSVDGVLINNEAFSPKELARILVEIVY